MNRKLLLIVGIPAVLLVLCIGIGVVASVASSGNRNATKTAEAALNTQLIEPLKALCTGQSGGVSQAAAYTPGAGVHPVVAFRSLTAGTFFRDSRVGTGDWSPQTIGQAQLVACMEDTTVTVESCPYKSQTAGTTSTLDRLQNQVKVRLVSAKTGQVVGTQTLKGGEPRECQDKETFASGASKASVSGDAVTPSQIQSWLQPFVKP